MKVALTNRRLSTHQLELLPLLNNKKQQDMFGNEMNKTFRNTGRNRPVVNFAFERTGDQHFLQGSTPITTPKQTINVAQMSFIEIFWCLALKSIFLFLFMAHSQCVQKLNKILWKLYLWIRTTNKCVWLQYAGLSGGISHPFENPSPRSNMRETPLFHWHTDIDCNIFHRIFSRGKTFMRNETKNMKYKTGPFS